MDPLRLVILTSITTPYRTPVFNLLGGHEDVSLLVIYMSEREPHRSWDTDWDAMEHEHVFLRDLLVVKRGGSWVHVLSRGLLGQLRRWKPDVVIAGGWDQGPHAYAYGLRRVLGYAFGWWVESSQRDARVGRTFAHFLKRRFALGADGFVVPGKASRDYVRSFGVPEAAIHLAPNVVDTERFARGTEGASLERRSETRFLFVGRLDPIKGVEQLLRAFEGVPRPAILTLVGDGPLLESLRIKVRTKQIDRVRLTGHLQGDRLVDEYLAADVFVFPSLSDPWGLVINEAVAAGLPVISTTAPGAVDDLVEDGRNGLLIEPGDVSALRAAMTRLEKEPSERIEMGRRSLEVSKRFTLEACAAGLRRAALEMRRRRGDSSESTLPSP